MCLKRQTKEEVVGYKKFKELEIKVKVDSFFYIIPTYYYNFFSLIDLYI